MWRRAAGENGRTCKALVLTLPSLQVQEGSLEATTRLMIREALRRPRAIREQNVVKRRFLTRYRSNGIRRVVAKER